MTVITISDTAKDYLLQQCKQNNQLAIRLSVLGGGCAGFSYQYDFCSEFDDQDEIINLDDEYKFVIDSTSLLFVLGTHLDYVNELGSSALKIINPNETSSCGCGKSFAI